MRLLLAACGALAVSGCGAMVMIDGATALAATSTGAVMDAAMASPLFTARTVATTAMELQRRDELESAPADGPAAQSRMHGPAPANAAPR